ncbi:MAG: penicillin acylase family protein [Panacibacter sp.]
MRIVPFILSAAVTTGLVILLNMQLPVNGGKTPRLGYFLSPQKGFWQNAEPVNVSFNANLKFDSLQGEASVYLDERLVPHVYADNEHDAFFIQGYLHAKFRLWQMDFQTYAAGGRLSEIMGDSANGTNFLNIDKFFRRLGMVYAAENSLKAIEEDQETKAVCDAYTQGVNAYISSLNESSYPLEYKLLDYKPEPWTNMKTALFLKYMSYDLAGSEQDFEKTNAKAVFTKAQYKALYPYGQDSLNPINPKGTKFATPGLNIAPPPDADSLYFDYTTMVDPAYKEQKPDKNNGSNNWAVDSSKTKSGKPILCNDPHLGLNLPSLWYEMQITAPGFSAYGASFPGAPCVVIGFNDSCAWGFTNAGRDVRDYYEVKFRDSTMQEYWYNSDWRKADLRDEIIKIKGKGSDTEHIAITVWGPVMYDSHYPDKLNTNKTYACRWKAHDGSNDLRTFYKLNYANNFDDYINATSTYQCPGQNMIFASKKGDIAIKQQGLFPAKWKGQGDFIMPGDDSTYTWRGYIPDSANLVMHNPARGFVSSANQMPYDTSYPYYLGGGFPVYRGFIINRNLSSMQNITTEDMEQMQTSNYNVFAEIARPVLLKYIDESNLGDDEKNYINILKSWNLESNADEKGPTVFNLWWDSLMTTTYNDEFAQTSLPLTWPDESTLVDDILKDSAYLFADDINTPEKETIADDINAAFKKAVVVLQKTEADSSMEWGKFKASGIRHLLRLPALSRLNLISGGGEHIINAYKQFHGPSWRMVVELTEKTNAYGIYPGGQEGNPGSKYYDSFVNDWLVGKYYKLLFATKTEMQQQINLKGKITFSKS